MWSLEVIQTGELKNAIFLGGKSHINNTALLGSQRISGNLKGRTFFLAKTEVYKRKFILLLPQQMIKELILQF